MSKELNATPPRGAHVLTRKERDALTPDDVLERLLAGNERFVAGSLTSRDRPKQVRDAADGQHPMAVILSCLDSHIPVEDVFDQGIGSVFVARVAGNFENGDILGSMEFAVLPPDDGEAGGGGGAKLILVLGHERCGAIRHTVAATDAGNITAMLYNIRPAVEATTFRGNRSGDNYRYVDRVAEQNVRLTVARIRERSPILQGKERDGIIKLVGGMYRIKTGKVDVIAV